MDNCYYRIWQSPFFFPSTFYASWVGLQPPPTRRKKKLHCIYMMIMMMTMKEAVGVDERKQKQKKTKNQKHFGQKLLFMLWCCEWEESLMQKNPIPKEWGSVFPPTTTINFFPRWLFLHANTSFTSKESLESLQSHSFFLFPLLLASSQLFVQLSYS